MPRISRYHPTASPYIILTILLLFVVSCNAGTTPTTHVTPTTSSAHATPTPHTTPTLTPTRTPEAQMAPLKLSSDPYSNGMG